MQEEDRIAREVVDAALKLHRHFGPGVYESVYEPVLIYELNKRSLTTVSKHPFRLSMRELLSTLASRLT